MEFDTKMNLLEKLNDDERGFSTIELIMALVIAGIMAAVALPKLTAVTDVDLYSVARQAKSDIRYTQELAMSKYRKTTITFGSNTNTYTITSSGPTLTRELPPSSKAIFVAGSTLAFTFNAAGEPITGGGGTLTISSGGSSEQITVSNITGHADIL